MLYYQTMGRQSYAGLRKAFEPVWDGDSKFPKTTGAGCFFQAAGAHVTQSPLNSLGQRAQQNTLSPSNLISSRAPADS